MEAHTAHGTVETAREQPSAGSPGVQAVLDVLESLGEGGQLSLAELTRSLGLPKTTVHRVCGTLVERGWVLRDAASGVYSLGIRAFAIGAAAADMPIVVAFRPAAADLLARHNETVCLTLLDGEDSLFVAKAETTHQVRLVTAVGSRLPAFAAASGRVLLADLPSEAVEIIYAGRELVTPTGVDVGEVRDLLGLLARVREDGFAENVEETALGLHCLAVPIHNGRGRALAAMTVCVPTGRIDPARREALLEDLRATVATLERDVAWLPTRDAAGASNRHSPTRERV
jgi:IclR family transcriptional regulator, KDG regulon repressor